MKLSFYFDEDSMDRDLIRALRARNLKVTTAYEAGMIERSDEDHLAYAAAQNQVLFSFNACDFYRLHTQYIEQGKSHAGIVLAQQQRCSIGDLMHSLLKLSATLSTDDMKNRIEFLSRWKRNKDRSS